MHKVGILLVNALQDRLTWEHGRFKGHLASSIEYQIEGEKLFIVMADYAEYIEFGTPNPTTPEEIEQWVEEKIMPKVLIKGKGDKTTIKKNISKSLAAHISKYGPRPYPFIRDTINKDLPKILASL